MKDYRIYIYIPKEKTRLHYILRPLKLVRISGGGRGETLVRIIHDRLLFAGRLVKLAM